MTALDYCTLALCVMLVWLLPYALRQRRRVQELEGELLFRDASKPKREAPEPMEHGDPWLESAELRLRLKQEMEHSDGLNKDLHDARTQLAAEKRTTASLRGQVTRLKKKP